MTIVEMIDKALDNKLKGLIYEYRCATCSKRLSLYLGDQEIPCACGGQLTPPKRPTKKN
jgi:DNA-directed RNA polymerase subunit RPC12/RpoP